MTQLTVRCSERARDGRFREALMTPVTNRGGRRDDLYFHPRLCPQEDEGLN